MFTSFSDIPGHQNLFLDYLYEFDNAKQFYPHNFRDKTRYVPNFEEVLNSRIVNREALAAIIENQYNGFSASAKTTKNIQQLKLKKTLAVVTGQQIGILGGPMYTIYKIITAIKLAAHLSVQHEDYNFVPVFWMESDDHDFEEIRFINIIDTGNNNLRITYNDDFPLEENRGSVGDIIIQNTITSFFEELEKGLRKTDFTPQVLSLVRNFYSPNKPLKTAFKELLFHLFDEHGLVIFDPQDKSVKELLKPIFIREIDNFRRHSEKLIKTSATLEEVYHAQVKVRPVNIFMNYPRSEGAVEKGRYLIEPTESGFRLKNRRVKFTHEELNNYMNSSPESFSPNVLLRPICQDYLFPTAFYIGGPSEVCYFAQVMPLYNMFGIKPPIIYPRSSATLVEKSIAQILEKYGISINDVFVNRDTIPDRVINSLSSIDVENKFKTAKNDVDTVFEDLRNLLVELDFTSVEVSEKFRLKILSAFDEFLNKSIEARKRKYEIVIRQTQKAVSNLIPEKNLQERELNFIYFANKYGLSIINTLFEEFSISKFEHQIISI